MNKRVPLKNQIALITKAIQDEKIIDIKKIVEKTGICRTAVSMVTHFHIPGIKVHRENLSGIKSGSRNYYYFQELDFKKLEIIRNYKNLSEVK